MASDPIDVSVAQIKRILFHWATAPEKEQHSWVAIRGANHIYNTTSSPSYCIDFRLFIPTSVYSLESTTFVENPLDVLKEIEFQNSAGLIKDIQKTKVC